MHSCKAGGDVALDIERIRHLEAHCRPGGVMFCDVNRAWLPREAITVMNALPELRSWFEQPREPP